MYRPQVSLEFFRSLIVTDADNAGVDDATLCPDLHCLQLVMIGFPNENDIVDAFIDMVTSRWTILRSFGGIRVEVGSFYIRVANFAMPLSQDDREKFKDAILEASAIFVASHDSDPDHDPFDVW